MDALNLEKGQVIELDKEAGTNPGTITDVTIGCGWDMAKIGAIDLDVSAITYDKDGNKLDHVFFNEKEKYGGALKLSGDNRTGAGDGDDESIYLQLGKLPANVNSILAVVTNYTGQPLRVVKNAYARVYDTASKVELAKFTLGEFGDSTALYFVKIQRGANGWTCTALGVPTNGKTFSELVTNTAKELVLM